jgi:hypothetical protein
VGAATKQKRERSTGAAAATGPLPRQQNSLRSQSRHYLSTKAYANITAPFHKDQVLCLNNWGIIDEDVGEEPDSDNDERDIIEERERQQGNSIVTWD